MGEVVLALGTIAAATVSSIAAVYAAKAEKNSRPVSNGFAGGVNRKLDRLEDLIHEHLRDHATRRHDD